MALLLAGLSGCRSDAGTAPPDGATGAATPGDDAGPSLVSEDAEVPGDDGADPAASADAAPSMIDTREPLGEADAPISSEPAVDASGPDRPHDTSVDRPQSCTGTPSACAPRSRLRGDCTAVTGCRFVDAVCDGTAWSCGSFRDPSSCGRQAGCYWAPESGAILAHCAGSPGSCRYAYSSYQCSGIVGCTWKDSRCDGVPYACRDFSSASSCHGQPGCSWM